MAAEPVHRFGNHSGLLRKSLGVALQIARIGGNRPGYRGNRPGSLGFAMEIAQIDGNRALEIAWVALEIARRAGRKV